MGSERWDPICEKELSSKKGDHGYSTCYRHVHRVPMQCRGGVTVSMPCLYTVDSTGFADQHICLVMT